MRRVVRIGLQEYEILPLRDARHGDSYMEFHNRTAAHRFLQSCMDNRHNESVLRDCLADLHFSPSLNRYNWHEIAQQLASQLIIGTIRVLTSPAQKPPGGGQGKEPAKQQPPEQPPAVPPQPAQPAKPIIPAKWVEFQVVDEKTGEGLAGVTLRVKLAERAAQNFATRDDGQLRIDRIMAGTTCNIEQINAPEYLEVVEIE